MFNLNIQQDSIEFGESEEIANADF